MGMGFTRENEKRKTKNISYEKMHVPAWCFFIFALIAIAALVIAIIALVQEKQQKTENRKQRVQLGIITLVPETAETANASRGKGGVVLKSPHVDIESSIVPVSPPQMSIQPPPAVIDYEKFFFNEQPSGINRSSVVLQCSNLIAIPDPLISETSSIMIFRFLLPKTLVSDFSTITGNTIVYMGQSTQIIDNPFGEALGLVGFLSKVTVTQSVFEGDMDFQIQYNFPSLLPPGSVLFNCNFYIEWEWDV
jgi:hypothetical protein